MPTLPVLLEPAPEPGTLGPGAHFAVQATQDQQRLTVQPEAAWQSQVKRTLETLEADLC